MRNKERNESACASVRVCVCVNSQKSRDNHAAAVAGALLPVGVCAANSGPPGAPEDAADADTDTAGADVSVGDGGTAGDAAGASDGLALGADALATGAEADAAADVFCSPLPLTNGFTRHLPSLHCAAQHNTT